MKTDQILLYAFVMSLFNSFTATEINMLYSALWFAISLLIGFIFIEELGDEE